MESRESEERVKREGVCAEAESSACSHGGVWGHSGAATIVKKKQRGELWKELFFSVALVYSGIVRREEKDRGGGRGD